MSRLHGLLLYQGKLKLPVIRAIHFDSYIFFSGFDLRLRSLLLSIISSASPSEDKVFCHPKKHLNFFFQNGLCMTNAWTKMRHVW